MSLRNYYGPSNANLHSLFKMYTTPENANNYFSAAFTPNMYRPEDFTPTESTTCTPTGSAEPVMACLYDLKEIADETIATDISDLFVDIAQTQTALGTVCKATEK